MTEPASTFVISTRLAAITAIALLLLILVARFTAPAVEASRQDRLQRALTVVLPEHDNNPADDYIDVPAPNWGADQTLRIFYARQEFELTGVAFEVTNQQGYSGPVTLLVGINMDGTLNRAEVIRHRETPGLGDAIESTRTPWLQQFNGKSARQPTETAWHANRRGGKFDGLTGATVSAEAVTRALYDALRWVEQNRDRLIASALESGSVK